MINFNTFDIILSETHFSFSLIRENNDSALRLYERYGSVFSTRLLYMKFFQIYSWKPPASAISINNGIITLLMAWLAVRLKPLGILGTQ